MQNDAGGICPKSFQVLYLSLEHDKEYNRILITGPDVNYGWAC